MNTMGIIKPISKQIIPPEPFYRRTPKLFHRKVILTLTFRKMPVYHYIIFFCKFNR